MGLSSYIAEQFAHPTGLGGKVVSSIMNRQNRPLYDATIRFLTLSPTDQVLDIGCGNGYVLQQLAKQCPASFVGIDPSQQMIASAQRRNRNCIAAQSMDFFCQDVGAMSFPDGAFTKIYTINTVYFWPDLKQSMVEISRILKPGGIFINALYTNQTLDRFSHTEYGYRRYHNNDLTAIGPALGLTVRAVPMLQGTAVCYIYLKPIME